MLPKPLNTAVSHQVNNASETEFIVNLNCSYCGFIHDPADSSGLSYIDGVKQRNRM
jgi:hypothetical protein